jgi:hypothetical protein
MRQGFRTRVRACLALAAVMAAMTVHEAASDGVLVPALCDMVSDLSSPWAWVDALGDCARGEGRGINNDDAEREEEACSPFVKDAPADLRRWGGLLLHPSRLMRCAEITFVRAALRRVATIHPSAARDACGAHTVQPGHCAQ